MSENAKNISSFTAADVAIPNKILHDTALLNSITNCKHIYLRHLQLCPTNKCNLACSFCSCSARSRNQELSLEEVTNILQDSSRCGCQAITITGGGEPLMHKDINKIIYTAKHMGIKVGLVTNGLMLNYLEEEVSWCRVSFDNQRYFDDLVKPLSSAVARFRRTDWAFSYVLNYPKGVDPEKYNHTGCLAQIVKYANDNSFTHIRVVNDIYTQPVSLMNFSRAALEGIDQKVIYQPRTLPVKGAKKCLISLLKPTIAADGYLYPCCVDENESVAVERSGSLVNVPIKEIMIGDKCIPYGEVKSILAKEANCNMLEFELETGRTVRVSPDHTMITVTNILLKNGLNTKTYKKNAEEYNNIEVPASKVKIGDLLPCKFAIKNYEHDTSISSALARFMGYYVAEGWAIHGHGCIGLAPGKDPKINQDIARLIRKLTSDYSLNYKVYDRRTTKQIMIYSRDLFNQIIGSGCGIRSLEKGIPSQILNAPTCIKKAFLKGYFNGDGHSCSPSKNYNGWRIGFTTVSRKLASDLVLLLAQLGVYATIHNDKRAGEMTIEDRVVNVRDRYIIKVAGYYNLEKLKGAIDIQPEQNSRSQKRAISYPKDNDIMFLKVRDIREVSPTGQLMYDIEVEDGNRFCAGVGQVVIHNCGIQYAFNGSKHDFVEQGRMGKATDLVDIISTQKNFDGSHCDICYYSGYNQLLGALLDKPSHKEWV